MTLGEKLRQAREDRGISLSEVAEQTRISPLYLESIENDDYRNLPGGIFNKGFIKTFAKYVGVDEQEAMTDYSQIVSASSGELDEKELKLYKPEVLTDDTSGSSMIPTVIVAVVILALMTAGILFLVNYLRQPADTVAANSATAPATNSNAAPSGTNTSPTDPSAPAMGSANFELKTTTAPVKVVATVDSEPAKPSNLAAGSSVTFTPKESLTLNYSRWNFDKVQLTINGKAISLPSAPLAPADKDRIIVTINKDNLAQIWTSSTVSAEVPPATTDANANVAAAPATTTVPVQPRPTPQPPKPANVATNTAANTAAKPPANAAKPPTMTGTKPTPKPQ
ncbi:MAG: helix-turn-helix domain-containing protein [Chloracidobacterium sp.]|nr:helix-turn-helix domain-containing protein [Chloracidobacterium sp.]